MSEELKPCPCCGRNEWEPWIFRGHPNMYGCRKCGTMIPWEKINSRPKEEYLLKGISDIRAISLNNVRIADNYRTQNEKTQRLYEASLCKIESLNGVIEKLENAVSYWADENIKLKNFINEQCDECEEANEHRPL